ncbi:MAG: M13 family metallopeptidase [Eubacteriales bacterium]|nr:M13 family metallopeptidase [Eubacteriales bacterium]
MLHAFKRPRKPKARLLSLILSTAILSTASLSGCGKLSELMDTDSLYDSMITLNETISPDSKWINSSILGYIDEHTDVRPQDDFYTAINRDTILSLEITKDDPTKYNLMSGQDDIDAVVDSLLYNTSDDFDGANEVGLEPEAFAALQKSIAAYGRKINNWEYRDAAGAEPLRPYIDAISRISDLDELTAYFANADGTNVCGLSLTGLYDSLPDFDRDSRILNITTVQSLFKGRGMSEVLLYEQVVRHVLSKLGYSSREADRLISSANKTELELKYLVRENDDSDSLRHFYTVREAESLAGNYPLGSIMRARGFDGDFRVKITQTDYLKKLGEYYNTANLEDIKACMICSTVYEMASYLDSETYFMKNGSDYITEDFYKDEEKSLETARSMACSDMPAAINTAFVAATCSSKERDSLKALVNDTVDYYKEMLNSEDWLSEESRARAVSKLSNLEQHVLYPDSFEDFSGLSLEFSDTLIDMMAKLCRFRYKEASDRLKRPIDRSEWDFNELPTMETNSVYNMLENAIYIYAGIVSGGLYDEDTPIEKVYGGIGTVIGHEISHAFDTTGSNYNEQGLSEDWWTSADRNAFNERADRLASSYTGLTIARGTGNVAGQMIEGEAIADMGGLKCMLDLAKDADSFDYDLFFRSYADIWAMKESYEMAVMYLNNDVHPPTFLRVNKTVQQFDEFMDTYDVREGDGMYLAASDRVLVW